MMARAESILCRHCERKRSNPWSRHINQEGWIPFVAFALHNDGLSFLSLPLLWGGWREAPGGGQRNNAQNTSPAAPTPTRHIVRSAYDVPPSPQVGGMKTVEADVLYA